MLYRSLTFPHCSVWEGFGPWARLSAPPPPQYPKPSAPGPGYYLTLLPPCPAYLAVPGITWGPHTYQMC